MKHWIFEAPIGEATATSNKSIIKLENDYLRREIDVKAGTVAVFDKMKNRQITKAAANDFKLKIDGKAVQLPDMLEFVEAQLVEPQKIAGVFAPDGKAVKLVYKNDKIQLDVIYEIYDSLSAMCKSLHITNISKRDVIVTRYSCERLDFNDKMSGALYVETNFNGGSMLGNNRTISVNQNEEKLRVSFATDINVPIKPGETFYGMDTYELVLFSEYYEHQMVEVKEMYRRLFKWVDESPIIFHAKTDNSFKLMKAIDQAHSAGFDTVVQTFGSGINMQNTSPYNIAKHKQLYKYAHKRNVKIGAYTLAIVKNYRRVRGPEANPYADPDGQIMRCLATEWSQGYWNKILKFCKKTGADIIEIDGPYHFYECLGGRTHLHSGLNDSRYMQWKLSTVDMLREMKKLGIYVNAPDWLFLNGSNKTGIGYEEIAFSQPRQEQLLASRIYNYKGTFNKIPSMAWSFVPISEYHGGGKSASFAPLSQNYDDYEWAVFQHFASGVLPCFRGARLYDDEKTLLMLKKWTKFYKDYKDAINGITVHFMPPIMSKENPCRATDIDCILNVTPNGPVRGILAVFNQTDEKITKTIKMPVYFTGLCGDLPQPQPHSGVGLGDVENPVYGEYPPTFPVYEDAASEKSALVTGFGDAATLKREVFDEKPAVLTDYTLKLIHEDRTPKTVRINSNCDIEFKITMPPMTFTWFAIRK